MQLVHMRSFILGVVLSVSVAGSLVLAAQNEDVQKKWRAVWHGTEWIDDGTVIEAQPIAENFEYLLDRINDLEQRITNIRIDVTDLPTGVVVAACFGSTGLKCYGGARGHIGPLGVYGTCPAGTDKFAITNSIDQYVQQGGGDGAFGHGQWYNASTLRVIGFLCIKR